MNIFNQNDYLTDPSSSTVGMECPRNPGFVCECHRKIINDPSAGNEYFPILKKIGKIRLSNQTEVSNTTPGFLPLKYEQPG